MPESENHTHGNFTFHWCYLPAVEHQYGAMGKSGVGDSCSGSQASDCILIEVVHLALGVPGDWDDADFVIWYELCSDDLRQLPYCKMIFGTAEAFRLFQKAGCKRGYMDVFPSFHPDTVRIGKCKITKLCCSTLASRSSHFQQETTV